MSVFPLIPADWPIETHYIPALLIGFGFGFVLEKAGFGNARILAAQFYLHNMRVFKVMFSAIVTAAVGVALFAATGLLDMRALFVPETFMWPHLAGGLLLGVGFIISGYCPGTSLVAAASGKLDGVLTVGGVVLGSVLFGELYPLLGEFHVSSALGVFTLADWLGIGLPVLVAALAVMAAMMFLGAEKVEKLVAPRVGKALELAWSRRSLALLGTLAVVGGVAAVTYTLQPQDASAVALEERAPESLSPVAAAQRLVDDNRSVYVVDLRPGATCAEADDRLPGAACIDDIVETLPDLAPGRLLLFYGAGDVGAGDLPAAAGRYGGDVAILAGGLAAWQAVIVADTPDLAAYSEADKRLVPALHGYFTGTQVAAPKPTFKPKIQRKIKKTGGCS